MEAVATRKKTVWTLDKLHSEIGFKVKHLMISNTKGLFKEYEATIHTEGADFTTAEIDLWIDPASINTRDEQRDAHLRNPHFFDVEQYADIRFQSKGLEKRSGDEYILHGALTMKGITKEIKLNVDYAGTVNDPWGGKRAGFVVEGKINRKDWGLTWSPLMEAGGIVVGEEIALHCEIELIEEVGTQP